MVPGINLRIVNHKSTLTLRLRTREWQHPKEKPVSGKAKLVEEVAEGVEKMS